MRVVVTRTYAHFGIASDRVVCGNYMRKDRHQLEIITKGLVPNVGDAHGAIV
jgi:hypothetical protein